MIISWKDVFLFWRAVTKLPETLLSKPPQSTLRAQKEKKIKEKKSLRDGSAEVRRSTRL